VGGAGQQVDAEAGGVLVGGRDQGRRQGRIVDRGDVGEHQFAGIGQAAVAHGVGRSGHRAVVVRCRGEAVVAIGIDHQRADAGKVRGLAGVVDGRVAGDGELRDDEVVAIDIAVVVEHVARDRRVFDHHDRPVVVRDGGVVDGGDGDRHVDGGGAAVAVVDGDGEAVGAVVVRKVGGGAGGGLRVEDQGAVPRRRGDGIGERVAVDVAAGDGAGGRRVLVRGDRGAGGDGRIVDGGDRDRHVDGGGAAVAVIDGDGEAVGAVVVRIGRVGVGAGLRVEDQGAVLRRGGDGVAARVAVDVAAGDGAGGRGVLVGVERGRGGGGRVVDRRDGDRDGRGGGAAPAVGDGDGEAVGPVEI